VAQARAAVARFGVMDPSGWGTGLSAQGAREAQRVSVDLVLDGRFGEAPNTPPAKLLIWCAANVFTAPLEWTARFAAWGSQVTLKAPSACPAPVEALAQAFAPLGVVAVNRPHEQCWDLVGEADAVLGFGGDEAMAELAAHIPAETPRSLHGHRVSLAVVTEDAAATAKALAMDLCLYDGQGCMSPAAIFCLGDPLRLAERLGDELFDMTTRLPRGGQPRFRRRAPPPPRPRQGPRPRLGGRRLAGHRHPRPHLQPPELRPPRRDSPHRTASTTCAPCPRSPGRASARIFTPTRPPSSPPPWGCLGCVGPASCSAHVLGACTTA
jgi:hypothetical protein